MNLRNRKRFLAAVCLCVLTAAGCKKEEPKPMPSEQTDVDAPEQNSGYAAITEELIELTEQNDELKQLLSKAIDQAAAEVTDRTMNPVDSLESYYAFIDRIVKAMPWEVSPYGEYSSLYERIDQGMGCMYFIADQPLEELSEKGYFHHSLLYHEPFRSWWTRMLKANGEFLNSEESWNEEYYQNALAAKDFQLESDLYEDPSNWKCFNDFFARKLRDPSMRPVSEPDDPLIITAPADSEPQGVWKIDDTGRVIIDIAEQKGIPIKTGTLTDISVLLEGSAYADAFANGTVTHTFLDIDDYHRYHFPVSGTVREIYNIAADDAPGGVIVYDEELGRYHEYYSETIGWQSIETRGVVIVETESGTLCAIVPVGMCQVSSVNFEPEVKVGVQVQKGDPLGYFLFGGSDIIMVFSEQAGFEMRAESGVHLHMGETYGTIQE